MLIACLLVTIGLAILVYGADTFVDDASGTAHRLGLPTLIIGLTVVGFATSAPEIIVGSISAWQGKTSIAIGNALGSNITNIGLVLGLSILILPMTVASQTIKREFALMCLSIVLALLLMLDGYLNRIDALILLLALVVFISGVICIAKKSPVDDPLPAEFAQELKKTVSLGKSLTMLFAGLVLLLLGAELLVKGAVSIAEFFGLSDLIIGLTIIAIGTSLPELAASIASLIKKEADIAIGNIIGSNMFNMLAVLGIPVLINPDQFSQEVITRDFPVMIILTLLLGAMVFISSKGKLVRAEGAILFIGFIAYQYILFSQNFSGI
ncbi:MAG: calcium/sodium antiporter [Proteobacteria bacterium]|nr:calcium/sodium antiporter [Pseudomonadota bacterium]